MTSAPAINWDAIHEEAIDTLCRYLRVVHELAAIRKAVRRDVEDAHDLRLIEPHGPRPAIQGGMGALQVLELRLQVVRQVRQDGAQFSRRIELARNDRAPFARDYGKAAGIGQAAGQTHGAALFALVQFYVADNLWRRYDIHPLAQEIRKLQDRGVAVANHGDYHAQYQFFGRLGQPLHELKTPLEIRPWFEKHPDGVLILYETPKPGDPAPLFSQPYIGETAILIDADQARARGILK